MTPQDNETTRLEAFSDGVLAIIITLLVFGIQVPEREIVDEIGLIAALLEQWPMYLAFAASFFFVLVMWINHHRLFRVIRRTDNNLLLLNGLLLFGISLLPFPTSVMAAYLRHAERATAVVIYNGWFLVIAFFFTLLWRYASHNNRLFSEKTDSALVVNISRQFAYGPLLYLGAVGLAIVEPTLGLLASVALAVFFALPNRAFRQLIQNAEDEQVTG